MQYTIQYSGHLGSFKLLNEANQALAQLNFASWMNSNAEGNILDKESNSIHFKKANFWGFRYEAIQNEAVIASVKLTGMGNLKINYDGQDYLLKYRGFLNYRYELQDEGGATILILKPTMNWKSLRSDYTVEAVHAFLKTNSLNTLLLLCGYGFAIKKRNGY